TDRLKTFVETLKPELNNIADFVGGNSSHSFGSIQKSPYDFNRDCRISTLDLLQLDLDQSYVRLFQLVGYFQLRLQINASQPDPGLRQLYQEGHRWLSEPTETKPSGTNDREELTKKRPLNLLQKVDLEPFVNLAMDELLAQDGWFNGQAVPLHIAVRGY